GPALQREALDVGGMSITGSTAKADHRIVLVRLEPGSADQARVLIGLEVVHPHYHRLWPEGSGDGANSFGQTFDEEARSVGIATKQALNGLLRSRVRNQVGMQQRQRVHLDVLADDEFHPRQPNPIVRQEGRLESKVRITQIDHDLGCRAWNVSGLDALHVERHLTSIDSPN